MLIFHRIKVDTGARALLFAFALCMLKQLKVSGNEKRASGCGRKLVKPRKTQANEKLLKFLRQTNAKTFSPYAIVGIMAFEADSENNEILLVEGKGKVEF